MLMDVLRTGFVRICKFLYIKINDVYFCDSFAARADLRSAQTACAALSLLYKLVFELGFEVRFEVCFEGSPLKVRLYRLHKVLNQYEGTLPCWQFTKHLALQPRAGPANQTEFKTRAPRADPTVVCLSTALSAQIQRSNNPWSPQTRSVPLTTHPAVSAPRKATRLFILQEWWFRTPSSSGRSWGNETWHVLFIDNGHVL